MENITDYIKTANDLNDLIEILSESITKKVINKYGIETMYDCVVEYIYPIEENEGEENEENIDPYQQFADVNLGEDNTRIDHLRNLSGEVLEIGNHVRVYAPRDKISNGYIGVLCKERSDDE